MFQNRCITATRLRNAAAGIICVVTYDTLHLGNAFCHLHRAKILKQTPGRHLAKKPNAYVI